MAILINPKKVKNKHAVIAFALLLVAITAFIFYCMQMQNGATHSSNSNIHLDNDFSSPKNKSSVKTLDASSELKSIQSDVIKAQLSQQLLYVANEYEKNSRYPIESVPIISPELAMDPAPYSLAINTAALPDGKGGSQATRINLAVERAQYFVGETIRSKLTISGIDPQSSILVRSQLIRQSTNEELAYSEPEAFKPSENSYITSFETVGLLPDVAAAELLVVSEVEINGQRYFKSVPVNYANASARLDQVLPAWPNGAYLNIPLQFTVFEEGYYYISAYLDDAVTRRPLLALQGKAVMQAGSDQIELKVHQQALKDSGSEGPYLLRVRRSFRGAEEGSDRNYDAPIILSQNNYAVNSIPFDLYENTPYQNDEVDEIIDALRRLGGGG